MDNSIELITNHVPETDEAPKKCSIIDEEREEAMRLMGLDEKPHK